MGKARRRIFGVFAVGTALAFAFANPALADAGCGTIPAHYKDVLHKEVSHTEPKTIPGTAEEGYDAKRWSRVVGGQDEVSHLEAQFSRVEPGKEQITHEETRYYRVIPGKEQEEHQEWRFSRTNPGSDEKSHQEWRFSRTNPGSDEKSHTEYQFKRTNPGQEKQTHKEYRFKRWVDGQKEQSHMEYRYERTVKDYKTEYEYEKWVKGTKEKKVNGKWVSDGTFDYRDWPGAGPTWNDGGSGGHHDTWTEGNIRYTSTAYKYVKTGKTREVVSGSHKETSDWRTSAPDGDGWTKNGDERKVVDQEATQGYYEYKTSGGTTRDRGSADWFKDSSYSGWTQFDSKVVTDQEAVAPFTEYKTDGDPTKDASKADWFKNDSYSGWTQFNSKKVVDEEAVAPFTEYKTEDGATRDADKADWFKQSSFEGWSQYGDARKVVDEEAVAPFTEYRDKDGDPTTDESKAAWFKQSAFTGWQQYGEPRTVTDQESTPDQIIYLVSTSGGSVQESKQEADAGWIRTDDPVVAPGSEWVQFGEFRTVEDQAGTPDVTYYLTVTNGTFGETTVKADVSWVNIDLYDVDTSVWSQIGEPKKVIDREGVPGYTEYYVHGGQPTRELGESNWTTDTPEGWTFVDKKHVVTKKAVPAKVIYVKIVDKKAWTEKVKVPAKELSCNPVKREGQKALHSAEKQYDNAREHLAQTGAPIGLIGFGILGLGALAAGAAALIRGRRNR